MTYASHHRGQGPSRRDTPTFDNEGFERIQTDCLGTDQTVRQ